MSETRAAHATLRLSLAVYALTALAGAWEVVASQAPGSMFYVGVLPGPAQSLRESAFMLATVLFVASQLMPVAYREAAPRWLVIALHVSALCVLASGIYGACTGLHGEQLGDIRHDALPLFVLKHAGYAGLTVLLGIVALRALRAFARPPPT